MSPNFFDLSAGPARFRMVWAALILSLLFLLDRLPRAPLADQARAVWPASAALALDPSLTLKAAGRIPMPPDTPVAHASALLAMPASHPSALLAFWFAGLRESGADVQIAASQFDRATQQWSAARFVVNRHTLAEKLGFGVRRLGNPVAWLDGQGRVHLFVVTTGLGGWAAARIVHLRQSTSGQDFASLSFEVQRVLPLSWLWNKSFLVRTAPLSLKDGGMVLPVHFEMGIKYPVALRFDASGAFLGMARISRRNHLLQPTLLMTEESRWLALMRDQSVEGKVAVAQTLDGGQNWTDLPDLALHNPNSSVAGLALAPGRMFLAHNSLLKGRSVLDLSTSADGQNWALAQTLARGAGDDEYSYPALAWTGDSLWTSYTDQRQAIAWQRFSFAAPIR
ncbi:MAG: sialidase family protein [Comamonadaceae bacterium]